MKPGGRQILAVRQQRRSGIPRIPFANRSALALAALILASTGARAADPPGTAVAAATAETLRAAPL
jgi:iron complex outermembrane receptor protein